MKGHRIVRLNSCTQQQSPVSLLGSPGSSKSTLPHFSILAIRMTAWLLVSLHFAVWRQTARHAGRYESRDTTWDRAKKVKKNPSKLLRSPRSP